MLQRLLAVCWSYFSLIEYFDFETEVFFGSAWRTQTMKNLRSRPIRIWENYKSLWAISLVYIWCTWSGFSSSRSKNLNVFKSFHTGCGAARLHTAPHPATHGAVPYRAVSDPVWKDIFKWSKVSTDYDGNIVVRSTSDGDRKQAVRLINYRG